ncbi:hypothetical protein GCM10010912_22290 [Paenibacillus albidus]|uniref:Uncharacterized protein n=1 Tax=Paenibacillus albidus TaxID=2041023 RepID=A0A917C8E7_9BACL|nr:hypothetical protein [Paenibacillus albidus]GGF76716.1 hypothetical protein GCM10010912_22290 [Paenibacillus albidus]
MEEKVVDVSGVYNLEISKIKNLLSDLENGRIYDLHKHVKAYGSLQTKVEQLKEMLNDLVHKVEYGKKSTADEIGELF